MNIATVTTPIVTSFDAIDDVTIRVIFRPCDPIGLTEVVIDPEPAEDARVLELLDAAIARLTSYRAGYYQAVTGNARPVVRRLAAWHSRDR